MSPAFQQELIETFPTRPASCNTALDSPLGMAMVVGLFLTGGRHITVLLYILGFWLLTAVRRRLAGGNAVTLENEDGNGNRVACACDRKQLLINLTQRKHDTLLNSVYKLAAYIPKPL